MNDFNLSFNQLQGQLPNPLNVRHNAVIDLSSNIFKGSIPLPSFPLFQLALSNNEFSGNQLSGSIPESVGRLSLVAVIDLSRNNLTGRIPSSIGNGFFLQVLDLQNNNLSGEIPSSLGDLYNLQSLHLSNNKISGEIPLSFMSLLSLETLDLGNNCLTGKLPPWLGDGFPYLRILSLRSNRFSGELPSSLSKLSSLQVLDLAENDFNGSIPTTFGELQSMTQVQKRNIHLFYGSLYYYEESYVVNLKNQSQKYTRTLSLMTSIDLSGNNFSGELPEEISKLVGLIVLNLSRNHFSGPIPPSVSQLSSLDLSDTGFSGPIPPGMSSLDFLGYLNLSNNKLSGRIPYSEHLTTFEASSFGGNSGLCGAPLTVKCQVDDSDKYKKIDIDSSNSSADTIILYLSIAVGFFAGISVPYTVIAIRRSWWDAYMDSVDKTADRLSYLGYKVARRCRNNLKHN
ncbi:receptor-like protein EIX2 [Pistacia vera]|uniref:receptor-like protein EIX2 n=1 Tax=Pistacia vera TaxID=55513 RepID=UPI0012630983|nr:receptor-like protein EIX2 [Pistacia vera]